jgi:hypothetical protein
VKRRALSAVVALGLAACAPVPRPDVLSQAAAVATSPSAKDAKALAPQAFARAEKLRVEADRAFDEGDLAGSQLLAERAIAAHAEAFALARSARGDEARKASESELGRLRTELATLEADHQRVDAELRALEGKVRVARDAESVVPSGKADPDRERARLEAARTLVLQGKLLCTAARLLVGDGPAKEGAANEALTTLVAAEQALGAIESTLSGPKAPIDAASRVRADCLASLTLARRERTSVTRASGAADTLLSALSASGAPSPARDDRGVFVTLRGVLRGNELAPEAKSTLSSLAKHAAGSPGVAVAVVVHQERDAPADAARAKAEAELVSKSLRDQGVTRIASVLAGARWPVADPSSNNRSRNARVEIVFVTPETL